MGAPAETSAWEGSSAGVEHSKSVKTKKQRAGWVGNKSQLSQHGTRLRLAAPGNPAPPTGDPQGLGEATGPRHPPQTPSRRPLGFRADLQQPGRLLQRAKPPPRKYQGCQGIENPGFPSPGPTGSISSMEKRHAPFYTEETESPLFTFSIPPRHARRPSTSETPLQMGRMNRVAAGPAGTKQPAPPNLRINPICLGRLA